MPAPVNKLKHALSQGQVQLGLWLAMASPGIAEMAGNIGYDWCLIDAEHGPNDLPRIEAQIRAMAAANCSTVVRVPQGDDWILKQVLDIGAQSVVVPMVDTAAQAADVVAACKYGPEGRRGVGYALTRAGGFGATKNYGTTANDQIGVIVQAETKLAMDNIAEIAAVPGVDCVFIGPADLSADMGFMDQPNHPDVQAVIDQGIKDVIAVGKPVGTILFDAGQQQDFLDKGGKFLGIGADVISLRLALERELVAARQM